jgi:hypothetical protein
LSDLRAALAALGDALAGASLAQLTAGEAALAAAVARLPQLVPADAPAEDRAALRDEALAVGAALARCRRLGLSLGHVAHATLAAQGRVGAYDRLGGEALQPPAQSGFGVRG